MQVIPLKVVYVLIESDADVYITHVKVTSSLATICSLEDPNSYM